MIIIKKNKKYYIDPDDYQGRIQYYKDLVNRRIEPTDSFEKNISSASRCLEKALNLPSGTSGKVIAKQLNKASRYLNIAKRYDKMPKAAWYGIKDLQKSIIEEKNKNKQRIKAEKKAKRGNTNSKGSINP